ncbi:hypothetical protein SAY87_031754 [Trapa incisa]|uniref:Uncharacterized protein n=1 Tax=Trapa incisa TaxID=236973 RepID=A0AAN7KQA0_9MYRT|nr:hypothetical protein SAY87_031754 [Trapa incisa]
MMAISSSGLRLGDFLRQFVAENCLSSSTVSAPKIGRSSRFLLNGEFDPWHILFREEQIEFGLFLSTGVLSDETGQLERLASTDTSREDDPLGSANSDPKEIHDSS